MTISKTLDFLCKHCYELSKSKGFWDKERNKGEMLMLMVSELSEMLEGVRKPGPSDKIPDFTQEEEEAADVLIRLLDYCGGHKLRLADAMNAKLAYNESRPYKHGKKF